MTSHRKTRQTPAPSVVSADYELRRDGADTSSESARWARPHHAALEVHMNRDIFEDLFVLELANNHAGSVQRGLDIITAYSSVVRFNNIRAAIKLQLRDVEHFVHRDFRERDDIRYIKKTLATRLSNTDYAVLVEAIRKAGCVTMATPFDEASVDLCRDLGVQILKLASSDGNDWVLIEKLASLRQPVMVSTGGCSLKDLDDLVTFFENRNIPLAINHCVSLYPCEDDELQLNQIDFPARPLSQSHHRALVARVPRLDELDHDRLRLDDAVRREQCADGGGGGGDSDCGRQ